MWALLVWLSRATEVPGLFASACDIRGASHTTPGDHRHATSNKDARTLLGAPGITTRNKKLLGAPGLTNRSKDATSTFGRY